MINLSVVAQAMAEINDYNQYIKLMQSDLPESVKRHILKSRRKNRKRQMKQARKLAVARESRSLNFWGSR